MCNGVEIRFDGHCVVEAGGGVESIARCTGRPWKGRM